MEKARGVIEILMLLVLIVASYVTLTQKVEQNTIAIGKFDGRFTDERKEVNKNIQNGLKEMRLVQQHVALLLRKDTADKKYVSKELFATQLENIDRRMQQIDGSIQKILNYIQKEDK